MASRPGKKLIVGALLTHQWDVGGEDDFSTSLSGGQYFYTINLPEGWQIRSAPTFSYDHKAKGGEPRPFLWG